MSNNNAINLLDAAYFSALAYADVDQPDAIAWGLKRLTSPLRWRSRMADGRMRPRA
jgi:hypothetical protein